VGAYSCQSNNANQEADDSGH